MGLEPRFCLLPNFSELWEAQDKLWESLWDLLQVMLEVAGLSSFHCPGVFTGLWRAEASVGCFNVIATLWWLEISNTSNIFLQEFSWKYFGNSVWNCSFRLRTPGRTWRFWKRPKEMVFFGSHKLPVSCECFWNDSRLLTKAGLSGKTLTSAALRGHCQISSRDGF